MHNTFKDLRVWKKSLELLRSVYQTTREYPEDEHFGLTKQIRRRVVSVLSNIAEGNSRFSKIEKGRFFEIAYGSIAELQVQLIISKELEFISSMEFQKLDHHIVEIRKMLSGLYKSQRKR